MAERAVIVHAVRDGHGLIQVREDTTGTIRTLHFGNAIEQSRYYLHAPFTLGFEYLQVAFDRLMALRPRTLFSLGLGGGRLNTHLHYALPGCRQTVVELRQAVIDIAHEWFDLPKAANLAVHCDDAFEYVITCGERFDAVFVDLFDGYGMPPLFATPAFMERLLACGRGPVLMNVWRNDTALRDMLLPWLQTKNIGFTLHPVQSSPNWILEIRF